VRELKLTGLRTPNYNRRADLVCFVNGLPLVFIELKAVYKNIRAGFDGNLRDYMDENVIAHAFHHNAFLIVSNGDAPAMARSPASGSTSTSGSGWTSGQGQRGGRGLLERHAGA
jgi:type I site-specific restriction-modification system R (restriction) subunit